MPRENENLAHLKFTDFDVAGNTFRAWRNSDGVLIFVLDSTIDEYKPNALLVIGQYGDRKWDDVLENDYGINLEDVRPKKDNKYQKLDIEYDGLDIYDRLIRDIENNADVDAGVRDLLDYRDAVIRRAATGRLVAAEEELTRADATATKAALTLKSLRDRRRNLRNRLTKQKDMVGREPTKQSAAKILRTEAQIDSVQDKIARAEKRLANARRRIDDATAQANAARALLTNHRPVADNVADVPKFEPFDVEQDITQDKAQNEIQNDADDAPKFEPLLEQQSDDTVALPVPEYEFQTKGQDMPDSEEVKPLLDQDPEILDDEIAFKPVEFDDIKPVDAPKEDTVPDKALSFNQPGAVEPEPVQEPATELPDLSEDPEWAKPEPMADVEPVAVPVPTFEPELNAPDVATSSEHRDAVAAPVVRPASPSGIAGMSRPVSPISGDAAAPRPVEMSRSRPTVVYYLLLIVLIALSVFTLWLYQKKNGTTLPFGAPTPELAAQPDIIAVEPPVADTADVVEPVVVNPEPAPDVMPEPELSPVVEPVAPAVESENINVVFPNQNVLRGPEPEVPVVESEQDVLMRKTPYGVSRDEKPILTAPEFIPEPVPEPVSAPMPEPRTTNVVAHDVIFDDDLVSVPVMEPDDYYQDSDTYYEDYDVRYDEYTDDSERAPFNVGVNRHLDVYDGGQYSVAYDQVEY